MRRSCSRAPASRTTARAAVSAFLVPLTSKGVSATRFNDIGSKAVGRGSIFFDDVRVPVDHVVGARARASPR